MSYEIEQIELIEKYIAGTLTSEERIAFESQMNSDSTLAEKVDFQNTFVTGVHNIGLKAELIEIHDAKYGGSRGLIYKWILSVLLIGLLSIGVWYMTRDKDQVAESDTIEKEEKVEEREVVQSVEQAPIIQEKEVVTVDMTERTETIVVESNQSKLDLSDFESKSVEEEMPLETIVIEDGDLEADETISVSSEPIIGDTVSVINNVASNVNISKSVGVIQDTDITKPIDDVTYPIDSLNELMSKIFSHDPTIQTIKIGDPKEHLEFTANKGTHLHIPPNTLVRANGKKPIGNVRIEMTEFTEPYQLLTAGLPTMADGKMLVSGGVVHLAIYDEANNELMVGKDSEIELDFLPGDGKHVEEFTPFYGEKDEHGLMDWKTEKGQLLETSARPRKIRNAKGREVTKTTEKFSSDRKIMTKTGSFGKGAYWKANKKFEEYINLKSKKLGWINCDRFYDKPTRNVVMGLENVPENAVVSIIFKDIKSVMSAYTTKDLASFNAPNKMDVWLVGIGTEDGKDYYFFANTNTSDLNDVSFNFKQASKYEIKQALAEIQFNGFGKGKK